MRLPNLKRFVRIDIADRVFEANYKADGEAIVRERRKSTATYMSWHGPAEVCGRSGLNAPWLTSHNSLTPMLKSED